jgi:transposase
MQAAELFAQGKSKAQVAGELGVSAQTADRWWRRWRDGGVAGVRTGGSPPTLAARQAAVDVRAGGLPPR